MATHDAFRLSRRVYIFGHRGARATAPENTIAAFDRAIDLGADGLELDVRVARDDVLVVHHDERLERTTNGAGALADHTSAELARLDAAFHFGAASGYPSRGRGIHVPTLHEVLARYPAVPLIVEMKGEDPRLPERTVHEIRSASATDRVCVGSFHRPLLQAVRRLAPEVVTSASRSELRSLLCRLWIGWRLDSHGYAVCQPPYRFRGRRVLSPRMIRLLHGAGIPVQPWTVNDPIDVREVVRWGADGLITDVPDVVRRVVDGMAGSR